MAEIGQEAFICGDQICSRLSGCGIVRKSYLGPATQRAFEEPRVLFRKFLTLPPAPPRASSFDDFPSTKKDTQSLRVKYSFSAATVADHIPQYPSNPTITHSIHPILHYPTISAHSFSSIHLMEYTVYNITYIIVFIGIPLALAATS